MKQLLLIYILALSAVPVIAASPLLTIVYAEKAAPVSWLENNEAKGIFVEVVEEIAKKQLNIPVRHLVLPWARAQLMVSNNQADGLVTIENQARQATMNISQIPIQTHRNIMMTSSSHPELAKLEKINGIEDLHSYRIGIHRGNGWAQENLNSIPLIKTSSIEQLLKMTVANRIDFLLQGDVVTLYYRKKLGLNDQLVQLPHVFNSLEFKFMVRKNSAYSDLPFKFDLLLNKMKQDGRLEAIFAKYQ